MNIIKNILMCIGGLFVLLVVVLSIYMFRPSEASSSSQNATLRYDNEFRALIINTFGHLEYSKIYPLLSKEYIVKNGKVGLKSKLINARIEMGRIEKIDELIRYNASTDISDGSMNANFSYSLNFAKGKGIIDLKVEKKNGEWFIHDFQVAKTFIN